MQKVEAVVIRERVETVIDAVEEQTGHVGVTVVEAVGHGRERGITHEYLVDGGVFTPDLIETWIEYKRENEIDPIRLRPHPHEFAMYYDI